MDDHEKLLSFLCAERQRVESAYTYAADRLHNDPDLYSFVAFERAKTRMAYFHELESNLDALLYLYNDWY